MRSDEHPHGMRRRWCRERVAMGLICDCVLYKKSGAPVSAGPTASSTFKRSNS